jgi:hypothetical protein
MKKNPAAVALGRLGGPETAKRGPEYLALPSHTINLAAGLHADAAPPENLSTLVEESWRTPAQEATRHATTIAVEAAGIVKYVCARFLSHVS